MIDDCVKALKEYVATGKTFDYVINDLTDIPLAASLRGECRSLQAPYLLKPVLNLHSRAAKLTIKTVA